MAWRGIIDVFLVCVYWKLKAYGAYSLKSWTHEMREKREGHLVQRSCFYHKQLGNMHIKLIGVFAIR